MSPKFKIALAILLMLSFSSCEEQEILNARKASDQETVTESTRVFTGGFTHDENSLPPCPTGSGAIVSIDFTLGNLDIKVPETNLSGDFSADLAAANLSMTSVGNTIVGTSSFLATFSIADSAGTFDGNGCLNAGDTYGNEIQITIAGSVSGGNINEAEYEINNICTGGSPIDAVCSGVFDGSE